MNFYYRITIPSLNTELCFKEYTLKHHKAFNKILKNEDYFCYDKFIDDLIIDLCVDNIDIKKLTILDKFTLLLNFYLMSFGQNKIIKRKIDNDNYLESRISIQKILEKIDESISITKIPNHESEKYIIGLTIPYGEYTEDSDIIYKCISEIYIKHTKETIDLRDYDINQRKQIIDLLSVDITKMVKCINTTLEELSNIELFRIKGDTNDYEKTYLVLNYSYIYSLIKFFFEEDLTNMYHLEYFMVRKLHCGLNHIESMTPSEQLIYVNIFKREQEEKEKQYSKSVKNSPNMNLQIPDNIE